MKTASTPSPNSLPSMAVPPACWMIARSAPSSWRDLARNAASPIRSVSAVDATISANRITAVLAGSTEADGASRSSGSSPVKNARAIRPPSSDSSTNAIRAFGISPAARRVAPISRLGLERS